MLHRLMKRPTGRTRWAMLQVEIAALGDAELSLTPTPIQPDHPERSRDQSRNACTHDWAGHRTGPIDDEERFRTIDCIAPHSVEQNAIASGDAGKVDVAQRIVGPSLTIVVDVTDHRGSIVVVESGLGLA